MAVSHFPACHDPSSPRREDAKRLLWEGRSLCPLGNETFSFSRPLGWSDSSQAAHPRSPSLAQSTSVSLVLPRRCGQLYSACFGKKMISIKVAEVLCFQQTGPSATHHQRSLASNLVSNISSSSEDPSGHPVYIAIYYLKREPSSRFYFPKRHPNHLSPCLIQQQHQKNNDNMQFSTLSILLFAAEFSSAARFTKQRWERNAARFAARQNGDRMSSLRLPPTNSRNETVDEKYAGGDIDLANEPHENAAINKVYSQNWAGSILIGNNYTAVTGTFVIPSPSAPAGGSANTEVSQHAVTLFFDMFLGLTHFYV